MSARSAALSGRKELLQWLNKLCDADYPAVESLRDGAAYCTIVEAAVNRVAQNCAATQSSEAPVTKSCADRAHVYLGKLDWSATAAVCENADPSRDSVSVREVCFHNMRLLQDMLQECVPAEHRNTVDANRLATGKLQDHVVLLRWLYLFMSKVLAQYSKKALEKKAGVVAGTVEGVKLNRTVRLRSRQASSSDHRGARGLAQPYENKNDLMREENSTTPRWLHAARSPSGTSSRERAHRDRGDSARDSNSPFRTPTGSNGGPAPAHTSSRGGLPDAGITTSSTSARATPATGPAKGYVSESAQEVLRERTVHAHYTRGTIAVPEVFRSTLVHLRDEVEELERQVLCAQERHNYHLTHRASEGETDRVLSVAAAKYDQDTSLGEEGRETLSLEELGELLEERDRLAQQYATVDAVVTRALQSARSQGKPIPPLLRDLVELLHPA
ncbi:hypothetical protein conserved [Leishmania donovani]|uniref:Hypothetical_protein_conserved n=1 Tax=Leishmania donovani TaxID=5661 RepID=A0A504XQK3_LEIDO|nr:hypothetical protein CGC20_17920 [Leishmania donovani]CAJ1989009.1 hypothetical protein conserved [Leishmania donovani]VDZ44883.1 hypothetical_protein_conserved [Leishmania donovani]